MTTWFPAAVYLAKVGMPVFVVMVALSLSRNKMVAASAILLTLVNLTMSIFAGERINLLLRVCSAGLAVLVWRFNKTRTTGLVLLAVAAVALAFLDIAGQGRRLTVNFYQSLTIRDSKATTPAFLEAASRFSSKQWPSA